MKGESNIQVTYRKSRKKKFIKDMHGMQRHRYTCAHKSLWNEICYAVRNAPALRQLGFYSQDYLPSNLFLLSDLLRIIQCSGLRRLVNMTCRIRNVEFARFFFLVLIPSCMHSSFFRDARVYISYQKRKYFRKLCREWNTTKWCLRKFSF